ncbi:minor capsid protein [uncultured Dialister sp.]|uniref:minor capsid protein n=1 Tax=uncultured Dialister sp. TaxID=278064 RepID=UPI0027DD29B0|nr:minor capsid protein [uncultured Dialister sp.]
MTAEEKEKAYWLQRFTDQTAAVHDEVDRATEELRQAWAAIIQDVANEINGWYNRFAAEQGLTMAEAQKALTTKELAGLKMSLREFEKLAKANANGKWEKELSAASARVRISRLEAMELGIRNYLWKAYQNTHNTAADTLRNAYTSEYYHNAYEMQRAAGKFTPMQEIPEDIINAALSHPWAADGREWSERIWDNREPVTREMQGELVRSIIQGKGAYESSLRLAQKMGTGQYQAVRLLQTEATYITTMADVDSFGAMGVEKVQYVATLEAHTCGTCGGLDDKVMNRKDAVPGVTAPPMHPNCRCTLVPYYGDNATRRWMKDPSTFERKTTGDMSFKEWQEKYIIKSGSPKNPKPLKGLAGGKTAYSNDHVTVAREPDIAYNDDKAVETRFQKFCEECKGADIENAVVITKDGEAYHFTGNSFSVDITAIGDKLQGAKVIHNHPDSKEYYGDCFSMNDFCTFFEYQLKRLEVISGLGRYIMEYDGKPITPKKANELYNAARNKALNFAFETQKPIEYWQLAAMKHLVKDMQGLKFRRCKK